jgi:peptide/nickel transport system substrate-binding protein
MKSINSSIKAGRHARLAAVLLAASLLCGCDKDALAPMASASPAPAGLAESTPTPGGAITLPMPDDSELGNPLKNATREMSSIYGLIFEGLLKAGDSGAPEPCLAENLPEPSPDGLEWTFSLRKGVKWQVTGRELSADDVKFTLDEIKALSADSSADYPYDYVMQYARKWEVVDDQTIKITFKKPFYGALQALVFPILPSDGGYDDGGAPAMPVGTGPYTVTYYEKGKSIRLEANHDWWRTPPTIADISVMPFPDNQTEISSLPLKQLDALQTEDLTVTQYRDSGDAKVYEYPTRYFEFIALNFTSMDIQDKKIRQAIAFALDRQEIVTFTYVKHATVSDSPVMPSSWLYNGKMLLYDHDVEEARRLIQLAGWQDNCDKDGNPVLDANGNPVKDDKGNDLVRDGFYDTSPDGIRRPLSFTLLTYSDETDTLRYDAAMLIRDQLAKAGIEVEVKSETWSDYSRMLNEKSFDMALCGCYMSPVPDYSVLVGTGGKLNKGGYSDSDMDALLDDIMNSYEPDVLKLKTGDLQQKIIDNLPIISLYFRTHSLLTSPDIGGVSGVKEESAYDSISQWYIGQ